MFISGIDQYLQGITNAKVVLANTNDTTLYTAPSASLFNVSIVSSIIACNTDNSSAVTLSVTVVDTEDTPVTFNLFDVKSIAANTSVELLTRDLVLKSGETLKVQASAANIHVVASIQEFTKVKN
jgi:hypothetical protein|tara:strand:+ start:1113 stop:1487 length:375 start_codon:yes stop_codon:yes gene_type:complete